jgi:hypothetical protein
MIGERMSWRHVGNVPHSNRSQCYEGYGALGLGRRHGHAAARSKTSERVTFVMQEPAPLA